MKRTILKIILAVCILAVVIFAALLVRELYIDSQSRSFYDDLFLTIETHPREQGTSNPDIPGSNGPDAPGNSDIPGNPDNRIPYVNFNALKEMFPGIVGWINLRYTPINYPIMQHTDNEYYLTRLPDGSNHRSGSIFLDYRNNPDLSDKSILIYGHHTRAGDMFGVLKHYREQEFYDDNPTMDIYTPEEEFTLILFAAHLAHSVRDHPPLEFESDEEFLSYIELIKSKSVFNSNVEVTAEDRIVSLVTCTYDFNDARLIVAGVIR